MCLRNMVGVLQKDVPLGCVRRVFALGSRLRFIRRAWGCKYGVESTCKGLCKGGVIAAMCVLCVPCNGVRLRAWIVMPGVMLL